jgi:hypothetical protein
LLLPLPLLLPLLLLLLLLLHSVPHFASRASIVCLSLSDCSMSFSFALRSSSKS